MTILFDLPEPAFEYHFTDVFLTEEVLTPGELGVLKGISAKRRMDFSTGRYCAREALKKMGLSNPEILVGTQNEPVWPSGFTGSISHSEELVGAVAASLTNVRSMGLDIEKTGRVKEGMWHLLFRPEEQEFLNSLKPEELPFYTTLFFSMKESFYKLQYPLTKEFLGFTDVILEKKGAGFELRIPGEFSGKKLLPEYTLMHYTRHTDTVISLCQI
jgi:4'-phosphopantetheinyl transferase EntD